MITNKGVAVPEDMAEALAAEPVALAAFHSLRAAGQREFVDWVARSGSGPHRTERLSVLGRHVLAYDSGLASR